MLRELTIDELDFVSGGLSENDNPPPTEDDFPRPRDYTGDEDSDGDGIPNWVEDPMIVTGDPSAPDRAMDGYREIATWLTNYILYSGVGITGYLGLNGTAGAALAIATTAGLDGREAAVNSVAEALFDQDADDDGVVNGSIWQYGLHPDFEPGVVYYP